MSNVKIGQKAPNFKLPDHRGKTIQLSDFKGKNLVLYFYPKDDTPGCTTQAIDFSAAKAEFSKLNTVILGISADTIEKHGKFIAKHDLTIDLASDTEMTALNAYGVWVEKSMYGRTYMGIERSTFLIDPKGVVQEIWRKVKVKNHIGEVRDAVKTLNG